MLSEKIFRKKKIKTTAYFSLAFVSSLFFKTPFLFAIKDNNSEFQNVERGKVLRYLSRVSPYKVLINRGSKDKIKLDMNLNTYRVAPGKENKEKLLVKTGTLKVLAQHSLATLCISNIDN